MLQNLHVKNLALITETEVEFKEGLNILTGETGAGKSIIIGSVALALGEKVPKELLRDNEETALVELVFSVENPKVLDAIRQLGIETEDETVILSRKEKGYHDPHDGYRSEGRGRGGRLFRSGTVYPL